MDDGATDRELLERWSEGERVARQILFERSFPALVRFFHNKVPNDTDDLIQKTLLACLESRSRLRGDSGFRPLSDILEHGAAPTETRLDTWASKLRTRLGRGQEPLDGL